MGLFGQRRPKGVPHSDGGKLRIDHECDDHTVIPECVCARGEGITISK